MIDKLKPCPFCGKDDTFIGVTAKGTWWLDHYCEHAKDELSTVTTVYGKSEEKVIERWNRRAEDDR